MGEPNGRFCEMEIGGLTGAFENGPVEMHISVCHCTFKCVWMFMVREVNTLITPRFHTSLTTTQLKFYL